MKISEAALSSGLSIDTIRFYERSGLSPEIRRGSDGKRRFSPQDVAWLTLLASLRETGMPMAKMRYFADLYRHGDETIPDRRQVLLDHSETLDRRRNALDRCAELLACKLKRYAEITGDRNEDHHCRS